MKKLNVLIIAAVILVMGLSTVAAGGKKDNAAPVLLNTPAWLSEMPPEDVVWGLGNANLQNTTLAMQTATTRAQTDAARQMGTLVQAMLTDYANESGLASDPRSLIAIENIERNIVNMNLTGATVNRREQMGDGTWWVRVYVGKAAAMRQISSVVNNEVADYAEFRAERALQMLEFELNRAQSRPGVTLGDY
jgi:hypothetical protein